MAWGHQLPFANGMHDFYAGDRTARRPKRLEPQHRPRESFHCSMVLVKLSEGIAPSAGLQNRACQLPGTRLLKRDGSCHKYAPGTIDRDGHHVSGRDSDGGPPPDCDRSYLRGADCGDAPLETPLAGRRGHTVHIDRVVSVARSRPVERFPDRSRAVSPSSASFHRRDSLSLSPCYAARGARLSVEPGAFPPLGRSATRVPLQRANTCGQSNVVPYGDGESVPSKLVADKGDDPSVGRRRY